MKTLSKTKLIKLDIFNPSFLGEGWSIESDNGLKKIDLSDVSLQSTLKNGENYIAGEENIIRLKNFPLNASAFKYFWEHQDKIPKEWGEKKDGDIQFIFFDGTILRGPSGYRDALYFCLSNDGNWHWNTRRLSYRRNVNFLSAVLASMPSKLETKNFLDPLNSDLRVKNLEKKLEKVNKLTEKIIKVISEE